MKKSILRLKICEELIDDMIKEQKLEYKRMQDGRTTRMKNADSKNWGMVDAENRIKHYKEVKKQIKKSYKGGN